MRKLILCMAAIAMSSPALSQQVVSGRLGGSATGVAIPFSLDKSGALTAPKAGTANRVVTKTSVGANTNTTVCPAATNPVATEIQVAGGTIGLGLNGQTLTAALPGTGATTPDIYLLDAQSLYTMPVASTNAITAYGSAQIVVCVQTLRQ